MRTVNVRFYDFNSYWIIFSVIFIIRSWKSKQVFLQFNIAWNIINLINCYCTFNKHENWINTHIYSMSHTYNEILKKYYQTPEDNVNLQSLPYVVRCWHFIKICKFLFSYDLYRKLWNLEISTFATVDYTQVGISESSISSG